MKHEEMKRGRLKIEKAVLKFAGIIFLSLLLFAIGNKTAEAAETISANATGQTTVSWTVNNLAGTYYFIKRVKVSTGAENIIWNVNNTVARQASYSGTDTGLTCNTGYVYHLWHGDPYDISPDDPITQTGTITTSACNTPPNVPVLIKPPHNIWTNDRQFCATVSDPNGDNVKAKFVVTIGGTPITRFQLLALLPHFGHICG